MVISTSSNLSLKMHGILESYWPDSLLSILGDQLSKYEKAALSFSNFGTAVDTQDVINSFIEYFLNKDISQTAYRLLYILDALSKELDSSQTLLSKFNHLSHEIKREVFIKKVGSLHENGDEFHILVSKLSFGIDKVTELAYLLVKYKRIREQMLRLLTLERSPNHEDEAFSDIDNDNWPCAVEDVIQILKTCFRDSEDIEHLLFRIKEQDVGISHDWASLYRKICKLVGKNITNRPLQDLQYILNEANLPEQTLRESYSYSLGKLLPAEMPLELASLLQDLAAPIPTHSNIPIVKFVTYLSFQARTRGKTDAQRKLEDWNKENIRLFDIDENWFKSLPQEVEVEARRKMYLLITVKSEHQQTLVKPKKKQTFNVSAWLVNDENRKIGSGYHSQKAVPFSDIPQCINEIRTKFVDYLGRIKVIDIFFQNQLLSSDIDLWKINTGLEFVPFITERAWVVRSLERAEQSKKILPRWVERWESYKEYNGHAGEIFHIYTENDCHDQEILYCKLWSVPSFCIVLNFVPSVPHDMHIFTTMLNEGVPIILWYRPERNAIPGNFPAWLKELLSENQIPTITKMRDLPILIWKARRMREDESKHLILLWDDPDRLPPMVSHD